MSWFGPKAAKGLQLGLGIYPDGVSLVLVNRRKSVPQVLSCSFISAQGGDSIQAELIRYVKKHKLQGIPTVLSLGPDSYSLIQVESPEVEADELPSAIRWRVKDLLDYHIDDAVLDVFDVPKSSRAGGTHMLYVVASRKSEIQKLVDQMEAAELSLSCIDICQLTLCNLVSCMTKAEGYYALIYLSPNYGMIEVVDNGVLHMNRRIDVNSVDLEEQGGFGLEEIYETLALELQRSLDFCETQFAKGPIKSVLVVAPEARSAGLVERIQENLSVTAEAFDLTTYFKGAEDVPQMTANRCLPALGAALLDSQNA